MSDEITITLTYLLNQKTESINVSESSTTLSELSNFAIALLGLPEDNTVVLTKDGKIVYSSSSSQLHGNQVLKSVGIQNGDLILVTPPLSSSSSAASTVTTAPRNLAAPPPTQPQPPVSSSGGLDFTSLLASAGVPSTSSTSGNAPSLSTSTVASAAAAATAAAAVKPQSSQPQPQSQPKKQGLTFFLPSIITPPAQTTPVQWDGMSLDQALVENPNPDCFVKVLFDETRHPNLFKELNYHDASLAKTLKEAGISNAPKIWREQMQKNSMNRALRNTMTEQKETEMKNRLLANPMDEVANKYFGEQIREKNVRQQYEQMMEEFPESLGRVLMLYIDAEVNGHTIQAFVDSGAQKTIMSRDCAEKCGLLHLLDTRFAGTVVGVGTGKVLGRVHMAPLKIQNSFFPCSIDIMDSKQGLGDKDMEFLFGLDMLKRHRCKIDLEVNALVFRMGNGELMEAPFLHEKDLVESRGGTKGFDAEKSNREIEKRFKEAEEKRKAEKDGDDMDVDGDGDGSNAEGGREA